MFPFTRAISFQGIWTGVSYTKLIDCFKRGHNYERTEFARHLSGTLGYLRCHLRNIALAWNARRSFLGARRKTDAVLTYTYDVDRVGIYAVVAVPPATGVVGACVNARTLTAAVWSTQRGRAGGFAGLDCLASPSSRFGALLPALGYPVKVSVAVTQAAMKTDFVLRT